MTNLNFNRGAIDASGCIGKAWELVQRRLGMYIGVGLVAWLMISCIPCANLFLFGPVMGGFAYLVLRDLQNEPVEFGMLFKGFEKFMPLMVIGLIQIAPTIVFQIIQYAIDFTRLGLISTGRNTDLYQSQSPEISPLLAGLTFGYIILFLGFIVFQVIWNAVFIFAVPLVLENDIGTGEALKLSMSAVFSNVGGLIVLMLLGALVAILGFIAFCFGLLVAIPVVWAANVVAYRQVFPTLDKVFHSTPPPPTSYGSSFGQGL